MDIDLLLLLCVLFVVVVYIEAEASNEEDDAETYERDASPYYKRITRASPYYHYRRDINSCCYIKDLGFYHCERDASSYK
ncbi:11264_t:CDS:1, partial [Acaulospora morrowiae]